MNDRTFKSSKWLVGVSGAIILSTLVITSFSVWAQTAPADSTPTFPPAVNPVTAPPPGNAAPTPAAVAPAIPEDLSPGLAEVVKLIQAHVGDDVVLAYIKNSAMVYRPTANEILYLTDLGASEKVLTALLQHNNEAIPILAPAQQPTPEPEPAPQAPAPSSEATLNGAPAPTYSVTATPASVTVVAAPAPVTVVAAPVATVAPSPDVVYFQDSLSPYGTWVYADGGWCWQPTVVVANPLWSPYCDRGRWIYTDCGWYWESDYSWGWAPFHYGRWCRHDRFGWVWYPDRVWGPAWVCWRHNDGYCGWAPLPRGAEFEAGVGLTFHHGRVGLDFDFGLNAGCFTFVAYDHFRDAHPGRFRAPHNEVANIYGHSKVVNNYTVINKTTIINEGVGHERMAALTHQPLHPVSVRPVESRPGPGRTDHLENGGKTLSVYRPPASAPRVSSPGVAASGRAPVTINHPSQPVQGGAAHVNPNGGNNDSRVTTIRPGNTGTVGQTPSRPDGRPTVTTVPRTSSPQTGASPRTSTTTPPTFTRTTGTSETPRSYTPTAASSTHTAPTIAPVRAEAPSVSAARPASRGPMVSTPAPSTPAVHPVPSHTVVSGTPNSGSVHSERIGNGNRAY